MIQKYRAYHEKYGIREVLGIHTNTRGTYVSLESGNSPPIRTKIAKLMQHTGIQDKNGREICEGDIIEFEDTFKNEHTHNNQAVVRKSRLEFFLSDFKFIDGGTEKCLMSNDCALIGVLDSSTVVGNVYDGVQG